MGFWDKDTKESRTAARAMRYCQALAEFAHSTRGVQLHCLENERGRATAWVETTDRSARNCETEAFADDTESAIAKMTERLRDRAKHFRGPAALTAFDAEFDKANPKD